MSERSYGLHPYSVPELTFPEREGGYEKGHETREQILRAALRILVDEGYRAMTMRRIATESGIKLGNLTYYYSTREDLVQALLEAVIASYETEFEAALHDPALSPDQRIARYCEMVIEDICSKKTTRVFPELWALANHDAFVFDRVYELYRRARVPLRQAIDEMRPDLDEADREDLAIFASASMEGLTVFFGYERPYAERVGRIEDIAIRSFVDIIRSYRPAPRGPS